MPNGQPTFSVATKFDFDTSGPLLGPVRLLGQTHSGFAPLSIDMIEQRLANAFDGSFDCARWSDGLGAISHAMNEGDLAKAAILTQYLPRPRFIPYAPIAKASPEDPNHPGWPKGAVDGKGGEFRPTEEAGDAFRIDPNKRLIDKLKARRQFREILKRVLTKRRVLRLLGEVVGDAIPFDVVAETATLMDLYMVARDISVDRKVLEAAIVFAEKGSQELESLLITEEQIAFGSYRALVKVDFDNELEKRFGPAGEGCQYHHIVEQGSKEGFSAAALNSTSNVVRLPTLVHEEVSAVMGRSYDFSTGRMPLREFLRGKSFEQQRLWGLWAMREAGALK